MATKAIQKDFADSWGSIPAPARLGIYALGAFALYKGITYVFSYVGGSLKNEEAALKGQGYKATLSPIQYLNLASQIRSAKGTFNDDEAAVYSALLKLNNPVDFLELQKAFGIEDGGFFGEDLDLVGYLRSFLNTEEKAKCNNILAQRNIQYRL
jgi:hypothetical protein